MAELTASDMSDLESTEGDLLKAKKPLRRSERINQAIKELDTKVPYQKARIYGSPSMGQYYCTIWEVFHLEDYLSLPHLYW